MKRNETKIELEKREIPMNKMKEYEDNNDRNKDDRIIEKYMKEKKPWEFREEQ